MEKIHIIARFKIQEGKLEDFKSGANLCISATKKETGALLYDWFIDEESRQCTVIETYENSNAVLFHAGNVDEPLSKLIAMADLSLEVYGNVSKELKKMLNDMNLVAKPYFGGI
jgi:quinol monooxygenase YgiN